MARLSIITVCFNEVARIEKTLTSVINQTFTNFEWILVDGGSTDGTIEIISKYHQHFDAFISEQDSGIYNAMNKAIALATGEYLFFLNAGDYLSDNNVLSQIFSHRPEADFVYGNITVIGAQTSQLLVMPPNISAEFLYRKTIPHQSMFTKKSLFTKAGYYNERYKIVADYEFILRGLLLHNASFQYVPVTFSCYLDDGVSSDSGKRKAEKALVHKHYYSLFRRFVLKHKIQTKVLKVKTAFINKCKG